MIRVFSSIRKGLFKEGKVSRYFGYAVGEIILIVVGILLALQISEWNQSRKDRLEETEILKDLKENLEINIQRLEIVLNNIQISDQAGERIVSIMQDQSEYTDSPDPQWHRSLLNHTAISFPNSAYESLKNTGFDVISSQELKKEILRLFEERYQWVRDMQYWGMEVSPDKDPFVTEHFILDHPSRGQGWVWKPRDYQVLTNNHYYHGLLSIAKTQRRMNGRMYGDLLKDNERVLTLIDAELATRP